MPRNKSVLKGNPRKIVIKPFSKPPALPINYYEQTVSGLLQGTLSVLQREKSDSSFLSLQNSYTAVVNLVSHQYGPRLYSDLRTSMKEAAALCLQDDNTQHHPSKLVYVTKQYQNYTDYLSVCKHVFLPLDRTHAWQTLTDSAVRVTNASSIKLLTIWQVGLQQFAERLQELGLEEQLYQEWLSALLADWSGEKSITAAVTAGSPCLQAVWYLWQDIGWLQSLPLQHDLEDYWSAKSDEWKIAGAGGSYKPQGFLSWAYSKHSHVTTWPWLPSGWLWSILEQCVIASHMTDDCLLLPDHLYPLLQSELDNSSLTTTATSTPTSSPVHQLWMLAGRLVGGQQDVADSVCKFAKTQGLALIKRKNVSSSQMISDVLKLQDCLSRLISNGLAPNGTDLIHLKSTWEEVVNVDTEPCIAESLAKFLDQILRSNKRMDDFQSHSDQWLERIIAGLFVPIQAKDTFEGFYKNYLAKRLLWNRVVSMDVEKLVCSLLKTECGAGYTSKMEGMFQDIDWSRENMMVYKTSSDGESTPLGSLVEMEVQVLTTGYWPVYKNVELNLPESLRQPQERFVNHYKTKYQGRRMTWQYSLGHVIVRTLGFGKTYELVVALTQALVLVQFGEDSKLTLPQLQKAVGIDDREEMERLLQSLSLGKDGTRILRKIDHDAAASKQQQHRKIRQSVHDSDVFCINSSFESNQRRIRIQNIMMKETKEEREKTVEAVSRDRLYLIDAVLVRIMKARKTISHQSLLSQVMEQVKVPAQAADIKKRIESLIEREYMERDSKDRNRYNYLA
jgi:cullin-4